MVGEDADGAEAVDLARKLRRPCVDGHPDAQRRRSTYFSRVHARLYNPFEYNTYGKLKEIESLGHEMALHYEPGFALAVDEDDGQIVRREKAILEAVLGHPVVSASAHLPGKTGTTINDDNKHTYGIEYEAYSPTFMQGFKYLSDSNGRWRKAACASIWAPSTGCAS